MTAKIAGALIVLGLLWMLVTGSLAQQNSGQADTCADPCDSGWSSP